MQLKDLENRKRMDELRNSFGNAMRGIIAYSMETWELWLTIDCDVVAVSPSVAPEIVLGSYPGALRIGIYNRDTPLFDMWEETIKTARGKK